MENRQTAIEWLIDALTDEPNHYLFLCDKPEYMQGLFDIIQQAIQMEKKQLANAWEIGSYSLLDNSNGLDFEQYYNETYGKTDTQKG